MRAEEHIQTAICRYLDAQYGQIIYLSDHSGIRLTIGQAKKAKAQRCKKYRIPDLIILHPAGDYHGLILELKKDVSEVYKKDLTLKAGDHIKEQAEVIERLTELGYKSCFACGFDHAKRVIDEYLNKQH